ncbi:MAG: hypothetical protein QXT63_02225 [Thermoplasmata archaeon]
MKRIERKTVTIEGKPKKCPECGILMQTVEIYRGDKRNRSEEEKEVLGAVYECKNCGIRCPYCDVLMKKFNVVEGRQIISSNKKQSLGEKKVLKCERCKTVQGVVALFFDTLFPNLKSYEEKMRFNMRLAPLGLGLGLVFGGLRVSLYSRMQTEILFLMLLVSILFFMISAWGAFNWAYYSVKMAGVRRRRLHSTILLKYEIDKGYFLDKKCEKIEEELKDVVREREVKIEL